MRRSRALGSTAAVALLASVLVVATGASSQADTAPPTGVPATVSADGLPTVQINGVVWAQVVVGNTVYVTGSFSKARPAGVAAGGAGEVTRTNLLAYDIRTGKLNTKFVHSLNRQGLAIARSPRGGVVYVGGDFTKVDGKSRARIAAFSTKTGKLLTTFHPSLNKTVRAITATGKSVFVGGDFTRANGHPVVRLAKFHTGNSSAYHWPAKAYGYAVRALKISPDYKRVVVAGQFTRLNGYRASGIGAVDAVTGAHRSWSKSFPLRDGGKYASFTSLTSDGKYLYGSAFATWGKGGNFEGRFASDFAGNIRWIDSCHGDSYSVFVQGKVLYSAGHSHDCSDLGAWDESAKHSQRVVAETTAPSGRLLRNTNYGYANFAGKPKPRLLHWFPTLTPGTFTGKMQAAWSITGTSRYVSVGGEFPTVNGVAQQGLVRFAIPSISHKTGPQASRTLMPQLSAVSSKIRVRWQTTWDKDNTSLKYQVYRFLESDPANATLVFTVTKSSNFWTRPWLGFIDPVPDNGRYRYKVKVTDPNGNSLTGSASTGINRSPSPADDMTGDTYANMVVKTDHARRYWPMSAVLPGADRTDIGQSSATTVTGTAAYDDLSLPSDAVETAAGKHASRNATTFTGVDGHGAVAPTWQFGPNTFSIEAWVKVPSGSTHGGQIVGFGNRSGKSTVTDRQLYFDTAGHLIFEMRSSTGRSYQIKTSGRYNNNSWHYVAGTFSASTGTMVLWVDSAHRSLKKTKDAYHYAGYWHVGGDKTGYLNGEVADVAVYSSALTATQVHNHRTG